MHDSRPTASGRAVFLSYASEDAASVQRIAETLRAAGVEVWFDQNELTGGDAWDQKIRSQIKSCRLLMPVISAATQVRTEGYFRREWKLAVERTHDMADHIPFLVPVVIDDTKDREAHVPDKFREVQWTRLPGGETPAAFCAKLKKLLAAEDALPVATEVAPTLVPSTTAARKQTRRGKLWLTLLAGGVAVAAIAIGTIVTGRREAARRTAQETRLSELDQKIAAQDIVGAFTLAEQLGREMPDDPALNLRWPKIVTPVSIETTPAGAEIYAKPFQSPQSEWRHLGQSPLREVKLPQVYTRLRLEKPGSAPLEVVRRPSATLKFTLDPADAVPADMVRVGGGATPQNSTGFPSVTLTGFMIDRHEVTNRQFKQFVDAGGYTNATFWRQPFVKAGATRSRDEALAEFRDSTGQPGPAGWRQGNYPEGAADLPVTGISWFEAAAYAEWAGKRLPSIYHWRQAARVEDVESIVPLSNFSNKGLAAVGRYQGVSACGAYDMAGNAKEWCWNAAGPDVRYALGGSWREPDYMFVQADALSPFDRSDANGFRCIKLLGVANLAPAVDDVLVPRVRDFTREQPVSDEVFAVIKSLYSYDKGPLDARAEGTDDMDPRWRKEKVSYRAAYGDERIAAYLFLPKNSAPPYQAIVYFPGAGAMTATSSDSLRDLNTVAVLVASGRALIYPVYKGTYERRAPELNVGLGERAPAAYRDWVIMLSKDLGRTIDYLETRPDIQASKVAYSGNSWGGLNGAILPAIERRIRVNLLIIGGFLPGRTLPEVDQLNFAPRNTVPTLMVSGRYDFQFPLETSQRPMFRWLGAPPDQKRHVLFDTGHALKPEQLASVAYAWLDQYLGLVK